MIRSSNMREKLLVAAIVGTFSSQAFSGTVTTDGADLGSVRKPKKYDFL